MPQFATDTAALQRGSIAFYVFLLGSISSKHLWCHNDQPPHALLFLRLNMETVSLQALLAWLVVLIPTVVNGMPYYLIDTKLSKCFKLDHVQAETTLKFTYHAPGETFVWVSGW